MHPLDNPTWAALTTHQAGFAQTEAAARRFHPQVSVHGAFAEATAEAWESLTRMACEPVGLFSLRPLRLPKGWTITRAVELHQMVLEGNVPLKLKPRQLGAFEDYPGYALRPSSDAKLAWTSSAETVGEVQDLTQADLPQMSALYEATRPGRKLSPRLHELGGFIGIRQKGQLLAMACLRLHLPGYREISTVGTLPGFEGRGYGTALVAELVRRIRAAGERPFLTVRTDNPRAIVIYQRLGFSARAKLYSTTARWDGAG